MEPNIKKVLVPIDFSDYSRSALKYTVNFIEFFKAEVILVYVIEPVLYPPDFSMGQVAFPTVDMEMDKRANEELEKLARNELPEDVNYKLVVKTGKPFIEIIDLAEEENVDLIIISTHGHSGMQHILFGSTADKVVRKAPCPVLTIREPIKGFKYKEHLGD
ncbi:MAG TPA: universal stress protein [Ignavibacteriaceae bacterium]|nr:universal stress protein [Ignavibacteriaceae bacterium]